MSFNYLLESDQYKRPFEISRVQSEGQGPMAGTQGFMQGAQFSQGMLARRQEMDFRGQQMEGMQLQMDATKQQMVARDIEIGIGQIKAQEAQMRLQAIDQELMVGMNKEAYLTARANRKLLEANIKNQMEKLQLERSRQGIREKSDLQRVMMMLNGKINAEGMTGRYGPYKKVLSYENGRMKLRPETEEEYNLRQGGPIPGLGGSTTKGSIEGASKQQKLFVDNARKTPVPGKPGYVYVPTVTSDGTLGMRPETEDEHQIRIRKEELDGLKKILGELGDFDPLRPKVTRRIAELQGLDTNRISGTSRNPSNTGYTETGRGTTNRTWEPSGSVLQKSAASLAKVYGRSSQWRNKLNFLHDEFDQSQINRYLSYLAEKFIAENDRRMNSGEGAQVLKMTGVSAFMKAISAMSNNRSAARKALREFYK